MGGWNGELGVGRWEYAYDAQGWEEEGEDEGEDLGDGVFAHGFEEWDL